MFLCKRYSWMLLHNTGTVALRFLLTSNCLSYIHYCSKCSSFVSLEWYKLYQSQHFDCGTRWLKGLLNHLLFQAQPPQAQGSTVLGKASTGAVTAFYLSQEEEAKQLVRDAIAAGIYNDLGSGSNIDICVISKSKLDFLRPYDVANRKGDRWVILKLLWVPALPGRACFQ